MQRNFMNERRRSNQVLNLITPETIVGVMKLIMCSTNLSSPSGCERRCFCEGGILLVLFCLGFGIDVNLTVYWSWHICVVNFPDLLLRTQLNEIPIGHVSSLAWILGLVPRALIQGKFWWRSSFYLINYLHQQDRFFSKGHFMLDLECPWPLKFEICHWFEDAGTITLHFTLSLRAQGTKGVRMDVPPTWSTTWHAMDTVSWSIGNCVKLTSKRWV